MHVDLLLWLGIFGAAVFAGAFGAMLGLGGGVIVIPVLTVLFDVPIKEAIPASLVTVIATSTSAAAVYVRRRLTNIRLAVLLEAATVIGALLGGLLVVFVSAKALALMFALILIYTAASMFRSSTEETPLPEGGYVPVSDTEPQDSFERHLLERRLPYVVRNLPLGMFASLLAGALSGLLGVGGGIITVPVTRLIMAVPLRVAIATSNFMIGVTAGTSALVYYARGDMNPLIVTPAALGVLLGAQIGTRASRRVRVRALNMLFVTMLIVTAGVMVVRALRGGM